LSAVVLVGAVVVLVGAAAVVDGAIQLIRVIPPELVVAGTVATAVAAIAEADGNTSSATDTGLLLE
jgi:hypothetical protein